MEFGPSVVPELRTSCSTSWATFYDPDGRLTEIRKVPFLYVVWLGNANPSGQCLLREVSARLDAAHWPHSTAPTRAGAARRGHGPACTNVILACSQWTSWHPHPADGAGGARTPNRGALADEMEAGRRQKDHGPFGMESWKMGGWRKS